MSGVIGLMGVRCCLEKIPCEGEFIFRIGPCAKVVTGNGECGTVG